MKLIQTQTLASASPTISFTGIPQNFTDLCFVVSGRTDQADNIGYSTFYVNSSTTNWTTRHLQGNGAAVASANTTSVPEFFMSGGNTTSNTFGNGTIYIPNYTAAVNKSMSIDFVNENNATGAFSAMQRIVAALWSNSSAITSAQFVANSGSNFVAGTTISLYGIGGAGDGYGPKATGGSMSFINGYWTHVFTASGTFTTTADISNLEYLVVAGGAGGGNGNGGGGGGAGGYRSSVTGESSGGGASAEAKLSLASGTSHTVTVGAGGSVSSNGQNSVFSTITSLGGGTGGAGATLLQGATGGSGGGAGRDAGTGVLGGFGTANQGFAGGSADATNGGGGGGGAGQLGGNGLNENSSNIGGKGGDGVSSTITGSSVIRGGGGGGTGYAPGSSFGLGGNGGGGRGAGGAPYGGGAAVAGTANTGGGGGGGGNSPFVNVGQPGGSGIVIVRYRP